jgi:hypothetical protein
MRSSALEKFPNLGATITARLRDIGIVHPGDLAQIGPVTAYCRLSERAGKPLPRCYYLYSLEAALRGVQWTALSDDEKGRLDSAAAKRMLETTTVQPRRPRRRIA